MAEILMQAAELDIGDRRHEEGRERLTFAYTSKEQFHIKGSQAGLIAMDDVELREWLGEVFTAVRKGLGLPQWAEQMVKQGLNLVPPGTLLDLSEKLGLASAEEVRRRQQATRRTSVSGAVTSPIPTGG